MELLQYRGFRCLFVLLLLTCQLSPLLSSCPPPFHVEAGLCLFVNTSQSFTWCSANHQCSSIGGELVNSHSSISMLIHDVRRPDWNCHLWIGLSDLGNERGTNRSGWQRVNGRGIFPLDESLFTTNEPSGDDDENCLRRAKTSQLRDSPCSRLYGFICEFVVGPSQQTAAHLPAELGTWQQWTEIQVANSSTPYYCYTDVPSIKHTMSCIAKALQAGNIMQVVYNSKMKLCRMMQFTAVARLEQEIVNGSAVFIRLI